MALGNVYMTDTDGNIGSSTSYSSTEKVCGLLFDISQQTDIWTKGGGKNLADVLKDQVIELTCLEDATNLGISAYTGNKTNVAAADATPVYESDDFLYGIPYYHIQQFFAMAGGSGRLFIYFADCSKNWNALVDMQRAANGVINQVGIWTEQCLFTDPDTSVAGYSLNLVADINAKAKELADDYFAPLSVLLCANPSRIKLTASTVTTINFSEIPNAIGDNRYVSVLLSQATDDDVRKMQASLESTTPVGLVGLALGCLTQASVGESIAWVQQFDLVNYVQGIEMGFGNAVLDADGYLTNSTRYLALTKSQLNELNDKGYMFLRLYEGLEGHVYFNKDQTCSNGDYCTIARNRAIHKSRRLVRQALLPYVNSPIKVDPSTGNLTAAQVTVFENLITDILEAMTTAEEISGIGSVSVPAAQNILVTKTLKLSYSIVPLGCAENIEVTEGLAVSAS